MGSLKVRIKLEAGAKDLFDELGINVEKAGDIAMTDTADAMANSANSNLADSIGVNSDLFGSVMVTDKPFRKEIGTKIDYASYVVFGTGPQKVDKKALTVGGKKYWPPADPEKYRSLKHFSAGAEIDKWRELKGTKFKKYDELRYAIYKKGTRPQRFMAKSLEKNRLTLVRKIGKELNRQTQGKVVKR